MSETTTNSSSRNEDGLIVPKNWTQFMFAIFVRLFEIVAAFFEGDKDEE